MGSTWRCIYHLTDYINSNGGTNNAMVIRVMHYGYSTSNNYIQWWFADKKSTGHSFSTSINIVQFNQWYYLASSVDYLNGKYAGYFYGSDGTLKYANFKSVTANQGVGLT